MAEPDYRYTLAGERTFLAWVRTALGLLAAAVALVQLAPDLGPRALREAAAAGLALLATATAGGALVRWHRTQAAMREGRDLRRGALPILVATGLGVVGIGVVVVLMLDLLR